MTRAIWICLLASFAAVMASTPAAAQQQKPSILFILADNGGYGDIGAYGGGDPARGSYATDRSARRRESQADTGSWSSRDARRRARR
jgi:hypothetical protein